MSNERRISVRLPEDLHRDFKISCTYYNKAMNNVVNELVKEWTEKNFPQKLKGELNNG